MKTSFIYKLFLSICIGLLSLDCVSACINIEVESNNTLASANASLCSGEAVQGDIQHRRDVDWFQLEAQSGNISITLNHSSRDDFDFELTDSSGNTVLSAKTSRVPETLNSEVTSGVYYIKIIRYSGKGWYDLNASFNQDTGGANPPEDNCDFGARPKKPGSLRSWLTGSLDDKCPNISGNQGVLLMGGNFDVDEAFINRVKPRVHGGDVVVLRTSGSDGYNDYLQGLLVSDSVETILVDTVTNANSDYVDWVIRSAEFVFIAGGDQSDYLNQWQGTKVETAIASVYQKGGVIGGTSAGAMIQSEWIYDPDGISSVYSREAVTDPCHPFINMSNNFLSTPYLQNTIIDTHFQQRDRLGRLAAFMSQRNASIVGIGIDEDTSLFIDANGLATVDGDNEVYIVREETATQLHQNQCGSPLIYNDIYRYRLTVGDSFNFATGQVSVNALLVDIDGRVANFYNPTNPY